MESHDHVVQQVYKHKEKSIKAMKDVLYIELLMFTYNYIIRTITHDHNTIDVY